MRSPSQAFREDVLKIVSPLLQDVRNGGNPPEDTETVVKTQPKIGAQPVGSSSSDNELKQRLVQLEKQVKEMNSVMKEQASDMKI